MFATLIVRITLISRFFLNRKIREINVSRNFRVIRYATESKYTSIKQKPEINVQKKNVNKTKQGKGKYISLRQPRLPRFYQLPSCSLFLTSFLQLT